MSAAALALLASGRITPAAWRRGGELLDVYGDYGSVRDRRGWSQFSVFWLTLLETDRAAAAEWAANWRARGYTHIALARRYSYPGSPIAGRDFTPAEFVAHVRTALHAGFAPILMLSDEPWELELAREIVARLKDAGLLPFVICCPGWEVVPGPFSSRQVSDWLLALHETGAPEIVIGMHLQPGRWSFSSNPVERDDPWQGDESGCWKSHGGEYVQVFLYQTEHDYDAASVAAPNPLPWAVEDRWRDGVPRMGTGMHGWRVLPFAAFETVLYNDYRNEFGAEGEAYARRVAARLRDVAAEYGVTVGYGNGAPPA